MSIRVIVLGDLMVDVVVRPLHETAPTSDTASTVRLSRGGAAANVAVTLAAAGCEVHFAGFVGSDAFADFVLEDLRRANVTTRIRHADAATGVVVAMIAPDGQRAMFTDRGANARLDPSSAVELTRGDFDHLHLSGYTILGEETYDCARAVIHSAIQRGSTVSVDVCSLGPLVKLGADKFLAAAKGATTLLANEEEALALSGTSDVNSAVSTLSQYFSEVMITCGPRGAVALYNSQQVVAPALDSTVIDTTGAGDAASGSYLAARLAGETLESSLARAMVAASQVLGTLGSRAQSR